MSKHRIAVLPGDGIGREVTEAALSVLEPLAKRHGFGLSTETLPAGAFHYRDAGDNARALEHYLQALGLTERVAHPNLRVLVLINVGEVQLEPRRELPASPGRGGGGRGRRRGGGRREGDREGGAEAEAKIKEANDAIARLVRS